MSEPENTIPYSLVEGEPTGDLVKVSKAQLQQLIEQHGQMKQDLASVAKFGADMVGAINELGFGGGKEGDKEPDILGTVMGLVSSREKMRKVKGIASMFQGETQELLERIVANYHPDNQGKPAEPTETTENA